MVIHIEMKLNLETCKDLPSQTTVSGCGRYLTEHLWKVVDICGTEALGLEAFGLQEVFSDIGCVDEHAMKRTLLISICLEHDLI